MDTIQIRPIGVIRSPHKQTDGMPIQGVFADDQLEGCAELDPAYVAGLKDLDGFSHAILLYHFHRSRDERLLAKPFLEDTEHGIFAIRGPHRPNHIGLSVVRIAKIDGNRLFFREVDILDGTPLLDVKPYVKQFDSRPGAVSGWLEKHFADGQKPPGIVGG